MDWLKYDVDVQNTINIGNLKNLQNSSLIIKGVNNTVEIEDGCSLLGLRINIEANNSYLRIEKNVRYSGAIFMKGKGENNVRLGEASSFGGVNIICSEGSAFTCGDDCMFAWGIEVRTTDSHAIFDLETNERINSAEDIIIGDHVWIAAKAHLLKGSEVARGSVVGISSTVTHQFTTPNSLIVGNPARLVRSGIRWERPLLG